MTTLIEKSILNERLEKSRSGIYTDTSENRRKHRVGQKYGSEKKEEEKPEKTSSNEKDPAKELEAVDKVIAAINEGKLKLPQEEIMVLVEKKNNLELAKRQAEKINAGVKANEEKRNAAEAKETSKKINEAQKKETEKKEESSSKKYAEMDSGEKTDSPKEKEKKADEKNSKKAGEVKERDKGKESKQKKYGDMNVEEAKKELLGKDLTITDIETGKTRTEKITSIVEGNVRGHKTIMAKVEGGGFYPIKHINTGKEWMAWKLDIVSENGKKEPESKNEPEKNEKSETEKETDKETYTRVKFDDVPNSGKINLKKYLSEKVRKGVDEKWSNIKNIPTENLKKMEKGLVNDLNKNFEAIKKSQRAELLYSIMKVKGELESRGKETQKKE